jgi:hypothetical protein
MRKIHDILHLRLPNGCRSGLQRQHQAQCVRHAEATQVSSSPQSEIAVAGNFDDSKLACLFYPDTDAHVLPRYQMPDCSVTYQDRNSMPNTLIGMH